MNIFKTKTNTKLNVWPKSLPFPLFLISTTFTFHQWPLKWPKKKESKITKNKRVQCIEYQEKLAENTENSYRMCKESLSIFENSRTILCFFATCIFFCFDKKNMCMYMSTWQHSTYVVVSFRLNKHGIAFQKAYLTLYGIAHAFIVLFRSTLQSINYGAIPSTKPITMAGVCKRAKKKTNDSFKEFPDFLFHLVTYTKK